MTRDTAGGLGLGLTVSTRWVNPATAHRGLYIQRSQSQPLRLQEDCRVPAYVFLKGNKCILCCIGRYMRSLMEVGVCLSLKINAGLTGSKTLLEGGGVEDRPFSSLLCSLAPRPCTLPGGCCRLGMAAGYMQMVSNCVLVITPLW